MQEMIEMAAEKETFLVPAPPPPLKPAAPAAPAGGPLLPRPQEAAAAAANPRRAGAGARRAGGPRAEEPGEPPRPPRNGLQPPPPPPPRAKRRNSCAAGAKHPPAKRRRRAASECDPPPPPAEFLLGGNIFDPLNLNSLLDEEVNRALNAETPRSSPLPARGRDPVEILIPKDITDPLSLNAQEGEGGALVLASPFKAGRKRHRHRGQPRGGECKACAPPSAAQPYELNTAINCRDEVVSPLLPAEPPGTPCSGGRHHHRKRRRTCSKSEAPRPPPTPGGGKGSPEKGKGAGRAPGRRRRRERRFQYGNYCQYYGYRNPGCADARLRVMQPAWFQGKEVLDLGCNVGHLTLSVAQKWKPARVVGLDIDGALIHSARQNIRHYLSEEIRRGQEEAGAGRRGGFPASLAASRGPIAAPRVPQDGAGAADFPDNVIFVRGNYVLERDELLATQGAEFDVVLCLSLTKWVQLNWGDEGLKRLFKRIYRHLRPGGLLLLEPQPWSSYGKRKNLTETIYRNYYRIKLKPEQFPSYLTSPEVGFSSCELVARPYNSSRGFQRPIYLLHKDPAH